MTPLCPSCGNPLMENYGRHGRFWGCKNCGKYYDDPPVKKVEEVKKKGRRK